MVAIITISLSLSVCHSPGLNPDILNFSFFICCSFVFRSRVLSQSLCTVIKNSISAMLFASMVRIIRSLVYYSVITTFCMSNFKVVVYGTWNAKSAFLYKPLLFLCSPGSVVFIEKARIFDVDISPHVTLCCIQLL